MANVTQLVLYVTTGSHLEADTKGRVFLGICGREFRCDRPGEDFTRGTKRMFVFGDGSNVNAPEANDPRHPQLIVEDAHTYPMYVRFEQVNSNFWQLEDIWLIINNEHFLEYRARLTPAHTIWLVNDSGAVIHLYHDHAGHDHP